MEPHVQAGSPPPRILIVDDELPIRDLVRGYLEREGYDTQSAEDGATALGLARNGDFDVIVLDVMLPGADGIEVCRQIRTFSDAYVLMLTARSEEIDKLVGLAVGADDYLTKPFSPRELVARIKALLRRPRAGALATGLSASPGAAPGAAPHGSNADLVVDPARRRVTLDGADVELTRTEFDLLAVLGRDPGVVVQRVELLESVWGPDYDDDHLIDVHIANLRRKLGDQADAPRFIETVRGVGYRMVSS